MKTCQLNPVYEWIGHVAAGLTGGISGAVTNDNLIEKETEQVIYSKLSDPVFRKKCVSQMLNSVYKEIRELKESINYCKKEFERIMNDPNSDNLDKEDAEWEFDTEELEEKISFLMKSIDEIKLAYHKNDIKSLAHLMTIYRTEIANIEIQRLRKVHKVRQMVLAYGGMIAGGVGYHYAKKGLKKVGKMIANSFDKARVARIAKRIK